MKSNVMDNKYVKVVWDQDDPNARELPEIVEVPGYIPDKDVEDCLKATSWMPADRDYFRGGRRIL